MDMDYRDPKLYYSDTKRPGGNTNYDAGLLSTSTIIYRKSYAMGAFVDEPLRTLWAQQPNSTGAPSMRCPTCEQTIAANGRFCAGCGTGIVPATTSQPSIATPWHSTGQLTAAAPAMSSPIPSPIQQVNVSVQAAPVIVVADQAAGPGATIIGLPLGLMMLNRLPQVVTLKSVTTQTNVTVKNGAMIVS